METTLSVNIPADSRQNLKPSGNGRNIVGQQIPTLLVVTCCGRLHNLLRDVAQSLKPVKLLSHKLPTFLVPRSATLLDPFTQLFQHCRGRACAFLTVYKVLGVVFFPRCTVGATNVGNYCIHMQTTAETDATTPNIVGPAMLGVFASVCT